MTTYPVHVSAHLEPRLNRWLWLVKWLLALPHYIVLAFLWLAFVVLSVVAFVAILVTGRYPRGIFDFNVGVLRWSWRVAYYAYGALGTDRYPPFTLAEVTDYPAHLEVEYPEHLSRGLVLVKWWLLAIPHYLLLGIFLGGGAAWVSSENDLRITAGLIDLLVLCAAVALLFTGRYPRPIFDLVLGLNRWVIRVAAYAALMTDTYPPFRLDQGEQDPTAPAASRAPLGGPETVVVAKPAGSAARHEWTVGRVLALVVGIMLLVGAGALGTGATALGAVDGWVRDDDGFLTSGTARFGTAGHAVVSEPVRVDLGDSDPDVLRALVGDVRLSSHSTDLVFVGIGPTAAVDGYLAGVSASTVTEIGDGTPGPRYQERAGGPPPTSPGEQSFWVARATGSGDQSLTWTPRAGDWTVVLMNADGSAGVEADLSAGATVPRLGTAAVVLTVLAALLLVAAIALLVAAFRTGRAPVPSRGP